MTTAPVTPEPTDPAPTPPPPPQKLPRLYVREVQVAAFGLSALALVANLTTISTPVVGAPIFTAVAFPIIGLIPCLAGFWLLWARQHVRRSRREGRNFDPRDVAQLFRLELPFSSINPGPNASPTGFPAQREMVGGRALLLGMLLILLTAIAVVYDLTLRLQPAIATTPQISPIVLYQIGAVIVFACAASIIFHAAHFFRSTRTGPGQCPSCGYHAVRSAAMPKCPECGEPLPERT